MRFIVDKKERYCTITPEELRLTALEAPSLKTEFIMLNNEGYRNIICNVSSINYADSSGLSSFLVGHRLCSEKNGYFVLCGVKEDVSKLLKLSQLDTIMHVVPTEQEAVDLILLNELEKDLQ